MISDIPFAGPISEVRVARIDGEFKVNPDRTELANADIVGNDDLIEQINAAGCGVILLVRQEQIDACQQTLAGKNVLMLPADYSVLLQN